MDTELIPLVINGKDFQTSTHFPVISPNTTERIWNASSASERDARSAAEAALHVFPSWSNSRVQDRRQIFLKAADLVEERAEELQSYMKQETGALDQFSALNTKLSADMLREIAGRISSALTGSIPMCSDENRQALVFKEPYGVVLAIAPWNAPFILGFRSVAYAIAAGNTCVLKGSETSPRCHSAIGSIFKDAGLPDGVLNTIFHCPEDAAQITKALIEHQAIKKINFTGSTAVGSIISSMAGKNLKPVLMELGGKASAIVCEDADIYQSAMQCALGAFLHHGQICMSTERILVMKSIMRPFTEELKSIVAQMFDLGLPAETPALAHAIAVENNHRLIDDAVSKGAKVVYGNLDVNRVSKYRMWPMIISEVKKDMDLYYVESFGPTVGLIGVDSDEEAIAIANDTDYGLSSAVFTKNLDRGLKIARQIESGAVHINSMSVHDEACLPHGGVKKSGWGRFNGNFGLDEFLKTKTVTFQT